MSHTFLFSSSREQLNPCRSEHGESRAAAVMMHENQHQRSQPCVSHMSGHTEETQNYTFVHRRLTSAHHNHNASLVAYTIRKETPLKFRT